MPDVHVAQIKDKHRGEGSNKSKAPEAGCWRQHTPGPWDGHGGRGRRQRARHLPSTTLVNRPHGVTWSQPQRHRFVWAKRPLHPSSGVHEEETEDLDELGCLPQTVQGPTAEPEAGAEPWAPGRVTSTAPRTLPRLGPAFPAITGVLLGRMPYCSGHLHN